MQVAFVLVIIRACWTFFNNKIINIFLVKDKIVKNALLQQNYRTN